MSKIDAMRRLREAGYTHQERALAPRASGGAAKADHGSSAMEGRCSVCGKLRALDRGLVTGHQKGLGNACPGSRKPPV
jgi:hypothetical protein